jgi:hypothetical protein
MRNFTLRRKTSSPTSKKAMPDATKAGPSELSIRLILGYSKALRVVDAPPLGEVDLILN